MPKSNTKAQPKVIVNIQPGPASPAQKTAFRKFWQRMIAKAKSEAENDRI